MLQLGSNPSGLFEDGEYNAPLEKGNTALLGDGDIFGLLLSQYKFQLRFRKKPVFSEESNVLNETTAIIPQNLKRKFDETVDETVDDRPICKYSPNCYRYLLN